MGHSSEVVCELLGSSIAVVLALAPRKERGGKLMNGGVIGVLIAGGLTVFGLVELARLEFRIREGFRQRREGRHG